MKKEMSEVQKYALSHPNESLQDIEKKFSGSEFIKKKETKMEKGYALDYSVLDGKKISNVKESIQMTVIEGKLGVLNKVTFDIVDDETEVVESSFFADVDSKEDDLKGTMYLLCEDSKKGVFQNPETSWFKDNARFNIDVYPTEMGETISRSIKLNQGEAKSHEKDDIVRFDKKAEINENVLKLFEKQFATTMKATDDLQAELKKFKAMNGSVDLDSFMDRYFFRKHILIQGEKGGGKTYSVDKKIRDEGIDSELIIGHEGIESIDLLGYYVKSEDGNLVWLDGALTKAFRKATKDKVCLFIDEMLRIPKRELNILVGSLTPSSANTYRLRTNRIINVSDGIGETEVIEIPMNNLWSVGTTNVGSGYEVDEIDDALADRFRIVNKTTSNDELESILRSYTHDKVTDKLIPSMIEFYTQMRDLMASGELEKVCNTRHMCEALQLSESDAEVSSYMLDLIPTWTSQDTNGQPNKAEKDIITKLIKKIIK